MAAIITDVGEDIRNLQQLKEKILEVKQSLQSINIHVDLDISRDLEKQLADLTRQYDALVGKIASAEARVSESATKINEATEKICNAQKKVSEAGSAGDTGKNNTAGAQAAKEATKAYSELAGEIDHVLGTREQNISVMVKEQNAIRLIKNELILINKSIQTNNVATTAQSQRIRQLNDDLMTHKQALAEAQQELRNNVKLDEAAGGSMNELSQSLGRMRMAYRALNQEERDSPFGKQLLASIHNADKDIKDLDASIGNHQRYVGNYEKGTYMLNMSLQQVVRELPSVAVGLNTFFLAISNNIPILIDEIKRAKRANEDLKASGASSVPVWKQLVSSLFSWQTALVVGLTVLSMYGKQIVEFIANLFKTKSAAEQLAAAMKQTAADIQKQQQAWSKSVADSAGSQIASYEALRRKYLELGDNMETKKKFIIDNQTAFNNLGFSVNNVTDAENLMVQNTDAVVSALVKRAEAAAYEQSITEATKRNIARHNRNDHTVKGGGYYRPMHKGDRIGSETEEVGEYALPVPILATQAQADQVNKKRKAAARKLNKQLNDIADKQFQKELKYYTQGLHKSMADMDRSLNKTHVPLYNNFNGYRPDYTRNRRSKQDIENEINFYQKQLDQGTSRKKRKELLRKISRLNKEEKTDFSSSYNDRQSTKAERKAAREKKERERLAKARARALQKKAVKEQNTATVLSDTQLSEQRRQKDLLFNTSQQDISMMEDGEEKTLQQLKLNKEKTLEQIQRDYEDIKRKRISEARELWKAQKQSGNFYDSKAYQKAASDNSYTDIEKENHAARIVAANHTYQQGLSKSNLQVVEKRINLATAFSGLGNILRSEMQKIIDDMKTVANSDDFRKKPVNEQTEYLKLMSSMQQKYGTSSYTDFSFDKIASQIDDYQAALKEQQKAEEDKKKTSEAVSKAQEIYNKALEKGTEEQKQYAKAGLKVARTSDNAAGTRLDTANNKVVTQQMKLSDSATNLTNTLNGLDNLLQSMTSGSLSSVWESFTNLDNKVDGGKLTKAAADSVGKLLGKAFSGKTDLVSMIISTVLSFLDLFKTQGLGQIVGGFIQMVFDAIGNLISNSLSGKNIKQLGSGIANGVKDLVNSVFGTLGHVLSLGKLSGNMGDWFTNGNGKEVRKETTRLTNSNTELKNSIDNLKDSIDKEAGISAVSDYQDAKDKQAQVNQQAMEMLQAQMGYHGSHHSDASKWDKDFNSADYAKINKLLDDQTKKHGDYEGATRNSVSSLSDIYKLTPEQMNDIRTYLTDVWSDITTTGKYDKSKYWEDYTAEAGKLEELTEKINQNLTQTSFDSLHDSFVSTIMDMKSDSADFANNFSQMMAKSYTNAAVGNLMDADLKKFYAKWSDRMQSGNLSGNDITALRADYQGLTQKALGIRNTMEEVTGYTGDKSQTATANGISSITYDQASQITGITTAIEIAVEQGNTERQNIGKSISITNVTLSQISVYEAQNNAIVDETRDIQVKSFQELRGIHDDTSSIDKTLKAMGDNISDMKKTIKAM